MGEGLQDSVLIVGGGIAGIQAALDLAKSGVHVILVESSPTIGGKMAVLDKNFPTLDCSICIEAPKMSEVMREKNIEVFTLSEVVKVEGDAGDFTVTIVQKPRFVTDECTRCNECVPACPVVVQSEFDYGMGARKAIYTPFPQSEPGAYVIDIDRCLNDPPNYLPCNRCVEVCGPSCIDFNMAPKVVTIKVRAIIVATGFELFNPKAIPEYFYGRHPDILTSIEFERMLQSSGPSGGRIIKPSDNEEPNRILFILCVGSRDERYLPYCSRICCMYTIKEALQAKDHGIDEVDVLYMDIRAYGKGFDSFYARARDEGVRFVRGKPGRIIPKGEGLEVVFEDTEKGRVERKVYDIVVLATAALPSPSNKRLARILNIDTDEYGFFKSVPENPVASSRPGIYLCGCATGPKDIPDTVTEASAAVAMALTHVRKRRWVGEEFKEREDLGYEPRVGVVVCHCGSNIAGVIDVKEAVEFSKRLPGVVYAEDIMFACAGYAQNRIAEKIRENGVNRLVVAACSPKTHAPIFQKVCMMAGLNPYLMEMANIRNQDTWVHKDSPEEALEKAKDMIKMAVEKAKLLKPLHPGYSTLKRGVLVVGGGIAGIVAASNLAKQGFETFLVEKEGELGGMLRFLDEISPEGVRARDVVKKAIHELKVSGARVFTGTEVETVSGYVGNYSVSLSNGKLLDVGAVIICSGARLYRPKEFGYENKDNVVTSLELESLIKRGLDCNNITFISCIGSRNEERGCSRFCCQAMLGQALRLRGMGKNVRIVYKDIRAFSKYAEELYSKACQEGVLFFQYPQGSSPEEAITFEDGLVVVKDELLGETVAIPTDLLVLNVGLVPNQAVDRIVQQLKVPKDSEGFLLELHPKLGPVETSVQGIFIAGTSQGPKGISETVCQALAVAAKASSLLSKGQAEQEPLVANIDYDKCIYCARCIPVCPFNAIKGELRKSLEIIQAMCQGCGSCAAECARDAIVMPGFTDDQIMAQIDAATESKPETKMIVFACNWCSYAGADQAGIEKIQYPPNTRIIRTMCSARISQKFVMRAFERGAGVVIVTGCWPQDCHYNYANKHTERRVEMWRKMLKARGVNPERLQLHWISAAEGKRFAQKMKEACDFLMSLSKEEIVASSRRLKAG